MLNKNSTIAHAISIIASKFFVSSRIISYSIPIFPCTHSKQSQKTIDKIFEINIFLNSNNLIVIKNIGFSS